MRTRVEPSGESEVRLVTALDSVVYHYLLACMILHTYNVELTAIISLEVIFYTISAVGKFIARVYLINISLDSNGPLTILGGLDITSTQ